MIFDRLKSILLFFAALSVGFAAYAQSTDGEKTVFIDFNSPECTFTGVKEGFETDSLYKALGYSTWFNRWSNTPFKYVNAPASEMPYGLSEREGSNALFEAYKPVTNINQYGFVHCKSHRKFLLPHYRPKKCDILSLRH